jgi:hypothetical protein
MELYKAVQFAFRRRRGETGFGVWPHTPDWGKRNPL